jgi:hypothetical protein
MAKSVFQNPPALPRPHAGSCSSRVGLEKPMGGRPDERPSGFETSSKMIYDHAAGPSQLLLHRDAVPAVAVAHGRIVNVEPNWGATSTRMLPPICSAMATG